MGGQFDVWNTRICQSYRFIKKRNERNRRLDYKLSFLNKEQISSHI